MIAYFKYQSTKLINGIHGTPGKKVWQRNYYGRIVRSEKVLNTIRDYIADNVLSWVFNKEYPEGVPLIL